MKNYTELKECSSNFLKYVFNIIGAASADETPRNRRGGDYFGIIQESSVTGADGVSRQHVLSPPDRRAVRHDIHNREMCPEHLFHPSIKPNTN